jgi:hypothetical protein
MKFLYTCFAETESLWSQGPVTRDFRKLYSSRPRYSTFKHFRVCTGCDKSFPRMLNIAVHAKTVNIFPLAEHTRKFVQRMLSLR